MYLKLLRFHRQFLKQRSKQGGGCGRQGTDLEIFLQLVWNGGGKEKCKVSVSEVAVPQEGVANFVLVAREPL